MRVGLARSMAALALAGCTSSTTIEPAPISESAPTAEPARTLSRLVVSSRNACVSDDDRRVLCWGVDPLLGEGGLTTAAAERVARVIDLGQGDARIVDLFLHHKRVCAAFDDGWRRCVQLEDLAAEPTSEPLPEGFQRMSFGSDGSDCMLANHELRCGETTIPGAVVDFDAGNSGGACALFDDEQIRCWSTLHKRVTPVDYGRVEGAVAVAAGRLPCVWTKTGELWCTEEPRDASGLWGLPPKEFSSFAESDTRDVDLSSFHMCVIGASGRVWCRGHNGYAQLGAGDSDDHLESVAVPLPGPAHEIEITTEQSCALVADAVLCWGSLGMGFTPGPIERAVVPLEARSLHLGDDLSCATTTADEFVCWGVSFDSIFHANTHGGIVRASRPEPAWSSIGPIDDYVHVAGSTGLLLSKGELVYGWVLHRGVESNEPDQISWRRSNVRSFELSRHALCPLRNDGTLECWLEGRVTQWLRSSRLLPRPKVTAASASDHEVCAVTEGKVVCGPIDAEDGSGWRSVRGVERAVAVTHHMPNQIPCALTEAGAVLCWDALHEPGGYRFETPPFALEVDDAVELIGGEFGVCARTRTGSVRCGPGSAEQPALETEIDAGAIEIDGGRRHWCARLDRDGDGTSEAIECHGENRLGQLGALGGHVMLTPTAIELPPALEREQAK